MNNNWIKAQDKKPKVPCLAFDKFNNQIFILNECIALKLGEKWRFFDLESFEKEERPIKEATYWMPLPEALND